MSSYLLVRARWDESTQHGAWSGSVNCDQCHIFLASDWMGPHLWLDGTFFWPLIGWVPICGWMKLATLVHVILL